MRRHIFLTTQEMKEIVPPEGFTPLQLANSDQVSLRAKTDLLMRPSILGKMSDYVVYCLVDSVVEELCPHYGMTEVERWAGSWLSGTDRSPASAREIIEIIETTLTDEEAPVPKAEYAVWAAWAEASRKPTCAIGYATQCSDGGTAEHAYLLSIIKSVLKN